MFPTLFHGFTHEQYDREKSEIHFRHQIILRWRLLTVLSRDLSLSAGAGLQQEILTRYIDQEKGTALLMSLIRLFNLNHLDKGYLARSQICWRIN